MATFFGRPLNEILHQAGISAAEGAVVGAAYGYYQARRDHDVHPFLRAARAGAISAAVDATMETALNVFVPGVRDGGPMKSAFITAGLGAVGGAIDGYADARFEGDKHPERSAFIAAGQWAVIDGATDILTRVGIPALQKMMQ